MYKSLTLLIFIVLCFNSFSQSSGLKFGGNITWHKQSSFIGEYSTTPSVGFNIGYTQQWPINNKLKVNSELCLSNYNYNLKNFVTEEELLDVEAISSNWNSDHYNKNIRLSGYYIELPIGINYMILEEFYLGAGYQIGYNLFELTNETIGPQWSHSVYGMIGFSSKIGDIILSYKHGLNEDDIAYKRNAQEWETIITSGNNRSLQLSLVIPF